MNECMCIAIYRRLRKFHRQKFFVDDLFPQKSNMLNILHNIRRPIPILVAKVWQRNLDYAKILQAKYFSGENTPIYSTEGHHKQRYYTETSPQSRTSIVYWEIFEGSNFHGFHR